MRDATRTFRTDRIKRCIDEDTGEIISDVRAYLIKRYEESPERSRDKLVEDECDVLRVLLYLGKADGQLRAAEKAVIRDTCVALVGDSRLTDKQIDNLFATLDVPTLQAFKLAVGRLSKRDQSSRQVLLDAAQKMIGTQKAVHQAEQEAIDYMRKRFAAAGKLSATTSPRSLASASLGCAGEHKVQSPKSGRSSSEVAGRDSDWIATCHHRQRRSTGRNARKRREVIFDRRNHLLAEQNRVDAETSIGLNLDC